MNFHNRKVQKLNKFMKVCDREVYYRMYNSRVLKETYNYSDIERDILELTKHYFATSAPDIYYLGKKFAHFGISALIERSF